MDVRTVYRVRDEYIDRFYGGTDPQVIRDYQENGIPRDDLEQLESEWGDLGFMLEEI